MFNPYIGLCKFIMALLVVAIHVEPFTGNMAFYYDHCLARIADPMFFTLSAYFLFDKLLASDWNSDVFFKQIKRLFAYYGIWLIVYTPIIAGRTWMHTGSKFEFVWQMIRQIFLTGPYGALWFIPALILGLVLTYLVGKYTTPLICLIISCPFFLLSVVQMEYYHLVKDIAWLTALNDFFCSIFGWLGNGVNFGWFFCALGLYLASKKHSLRSYRQDVCLTVFWGCMLVLECTMIRHFSLGISYGVMLMLIPVTYYLMWIVLRMPEAIKAGNHTFEKNAKYLQDMSLLIFPLHYGIMELMEHVLRNVSWYIASTTIQYIVVIVITCTISALILYLGKRIRFFRLFYGR